MSVRGNDRQLERAWRSRPPRGQQAARAVIALVVAGFVGVIGALTVRSCGVEDEPAETLPPVTDPTTTTTTPPTTTTVAQFYEIQPGDSLFSIAQRFETDISEIASLNGITDLDKIQAGQKIRIPPPTVLVTAPPFTVAPESNGPDDAPSEVPGDTPTTLPGP
jgi:LysM repeat protein